eukprot:3612275-Rhodomonas_salina.5
MVARRRGFRTTDTHTTIRGDFVPQTRIARYRGCCTTNSSEVSRRSMLRSAFAISCTRVCVSSRLRKRHLSPPDHVTIAGLHPPKSLFPQAKSAVSRAEQPACPPLMAVNGHQPASRAHRRPVPLRRASPRPSNPSGVRTWGPVSVPDIASSVSVSVRERVCRRYFAPLPQYQTPRRRMRVCSTVSTRNRVGERGVATSGRSSHVVREEGPYPPLGPYAMSVPDIA